MKSFVTTGNGDDGTTRLISGEVVPKDHPAVACTGELDSMRADLALLRLEIIESGRGDADTLAEDLLWIVHVCFLIGTQVNDPGGARPEYRVDTVSAKHLKALEAKQAALEQGLDIPRQFIATASNRLAGRADCAATRVRQFERALMALSRSEPAFEPADLLRFTNRLSDYLVVLARHLEDGLHHPVDYDLLKGGAP